MAPTNLQQLKDELAQIAECAGLCDQCAAECIDQGDASLTHCIKLCLGCAETCRLCLKLMSYGLDQSKDACRLCAQLCDDCATECEKGEGDLMERCAQACRKCADICRQLAA
jgi:hypothetical protein